MEQMGARLKSGSVLQLNMRCIQFSFPVLPPQNWEGIITESARNNEAMSRFHSCSHGWSLDQVTVRWQPMSPRPRHRAEGLGTVCSQQLGTTLGQNTWEEGWLQLVDREQIRREMDSVPACVFVLRPFACLLKSSNPSVATGGSNAENYCWWQTPRTNLNQTE